MKYNPPSKGSRRDLEQTLDRLTREVVLAQERTCFTCHQPGTPADPLECSHLFTRTWRPTRWDISPIGGNCHAQHKSENNNHEKNPQVYIQEFCLRFGQSTYDALDARAHNHHKFTFVELYEMIAERGWILERMKNGTSTEAG